MMGTTIQIFIAIVALIGGFFLGRRTERHVLNLTTSILDIIKDRAHFTKRSVYINFTSGPDDPVWHVTDTLSIDKEYYEYFSRAKKHRGELEKITFFAPLMLLNPVLVGAVMRKSLAPKITIRHLPKEKVELLKLRFPFKTVVSRGMILVGNQKIGSSVGCEYGHFSISNPNPYAEFVKNIYKEEEIEKGQTLEKWIITKWSAEKGDEIIAKVPDRLRDFLMGDRAIEHYLEYHNKDSVIGRDSINKAVTELAKRLIKIQNSNEV